MIRVADGTGRTAEGPGRLPSRPETPTPVRRGTDGATLQVRHGIGDRSVVTEAGSRHEIGVGLDGVG